MNIKHIILLTIVISFATSAIVTSLIIGGGVLPMLKPELRQEAREKFDIFAKPSPDSAKPERKGEESAKAAGQEDLIVSAVKKASPAVVSVIVSKDLPVMEQYFTNPFGNDFFGFQIPQYRQKGTEKKEVGGGSGFIISADGMIVTNKHVVEDEQAEYTVLTNDGKKYPARVLARDSLNDLAVLKIEEKNLPVLKLGDSDKIEIGQTAIAIGNALGEFRNTVSAGIVSGLKRSVAAGGMASGTEQLQEVIQTDAAINPGNSGGPLLNLAGEVIGVNTAMAQGAENIGFAIPINQIKKSIESVKKNGKISYPWLGVRYVLITEELKKKNNLSVGYGALVSRGEKQDDLAVVPGSPADKAGIVENDIILEVNGVKINQENTLAALVQKRQIGEEIDLKILHKGEEKTVKVKLEERK